MTFLNATLILGTLAAVVPIVLHLIARREPRKVVFPSIAFLTKRYESNRSRLRVRRWWLLAMRIATVVALAITLARPAIHQSLSLAWITIAMIAAFGVALLVMASLAIAKGQSRKLSTGLISGAVVALLTATGWGVYSWASGPSVSVEMNQPLAIAIVMDNSPTSAWRSTNPSVTGTENVDEQIAKMRDVAVWVLSRLPRSSRIAVLDRGGGPAAFSLDVGGAVSKIEQIRPLQTVQSIASRIDAAARLLRTSDIETRRILVISDLTMSTWNESTAQAGLSETVGQDPPIGVTVFDLGAMTGTNRSLSIPKIADPTPPIGVPVSIATTLSMSKSDSDSTGSGEQSVTVELEMFDDDPSLPIVRDSAVVYPAVRSVDRASVKISPGGSSELLMTISSLAVGTHHGRVRLTGDDAMPLDDVRFFSLSVLPPSPILLVSDQQAEAAIIIQAITASPVIAEDGNSEFLIERVGFNDLAVARLADYEVVVLLDPPPSVLSDPSVAEFLAGGGGVLISLGPSAGDQAISSAFAPDLKRRWRVPDDRTFLQVTASSHPVTEVVAQDTPWSDFGIAQYWQVATEPGDQVLMQYAGTDHAALVERIVASGGDATLPGRILVLTTPIPALVQSTRGWNDLFGTDPWPAWLLVRQIIEYLAGHGQADSMSLVGTPQLVSIGDQRIAKPTKEDDVGAKSIGSTVDGAGKPANRLQLFPPDGVSPIPIEVPALADRVVISDVPSAGTYWLRGGSPGLGFSANLPPELTATPRIESSELEAVFGATGYDLVTDRDQIEMSDDRAASRLSLQSPAMLLALIVFLIEQILGNRFYRSPAN